MKIISVNNLTKVFKKPVRGDGLNGMIKALFSRKYDEVRAVDGISFDINEGEIVEVDTRDGSYLGRVKA